MTPAQFETRFNDALKDQKKSMLIVCIPALALALGLLYAGHGYYVSEHFVFSVHIFPFLLVLLALYAAFLVALITGLRAFAVPLQRLAWLDGDFGIKLILLAGMGTYTYLALRRAYADRPLTAVLRTGVVLLVIERLTDL